MEDMKLYPAWKEAVRALIQSGLTYGSTVETEQIIALCGMQRPATLEQKDKFDLRLMGYIFSIKEALLTDHQMLLATNRDGTYRVVEPKDQTQYAVEQGKRAIAREMQRMAMGVQYVNTALLDGDQRRRNADAQAKITMLAGMQRTVVNDLTGTAGQP